MKITVVTVCYNAADVIELTIKSVLAQTYHNLEYIIIDGKSADGTMEIVGRYADKISKIVSEPDTGVYDAMNKGIRLATGDYINFMNAGDTFSSETAVADVVKQTNPDMDVIFGDSIMVDYNGEKIVCLADTDVSMLKKRPVYRHNASFTRVELHKKVPFALEKKEKFKYALDYNHIFNIWKSGASFQKVDVNVVTWDKRGLSDRNVQNVKLMFAISHQFCKPNIKERLMFMYDYLKALRRDIVRKFNS